MGATGHTYLRVDAFDYVSTFTIKMFYVKVPMLVKNDFRRISKLSSFTTVAGKRAHQKLFLYLSCFDCKHKHSKLF